jgi:folate-binding protein YgfZ
MMQMNTVSGGLPHIGLLRLAGADTASYLQGQLTNDTRRLGTGRAMLGALCSPQGRVAAMLHLLPHSSGVVALAPHDVLASTAERLRKFVLRAKVSIEVLGGDHAVAGVHGLAALHAAGLAAPEHVHGYLECDGVGVAGADRSGQRWWVIGPAALLAERGLAGDADAAPRIERDWRLADIRAGMPQVYAATREAFVPQMLNLDLIDGISFSKGCYTGQEIVARTQHLGRIKRRMFHLRLPPGGWTIGQPLRLADGRSGRLTELAAEGGAFEALAVLNLDAAAPEAESVPPLPESAGSAPVAAVAAVAAVELSLPYPFGASAGVPA